MDSEKRIFRVISLMCRNIKYRDRMLIYMGILYMFSFTIFDLIMALYPKMLLDMYLSNKSSYKIGCCIIIFFVLGCVMGFTNSIIREKATAKIGYLRVDYLAEAFNKIITCDYKNMEDASFFNKYDSAFDACSNDKSGIEKVYNILFDLLAVLLKILIFSILIMRFSPFVLMAVVINGVVIYGLKKRAASFKYKYKENFSKINRKKRYFNNITQDFQYGKEIRLYNFRDILNEKYKEEIEKYKLMFSNVRNMEFKLNVFGSITMFISNIVIYGALLFKAAAAGSVTISEITMYFIIINVLMGSINLVLGYFADIYGESLFISDYFDFMNADLSEKQTAKCDFRVPSCVGIEIKHLNFKYPNTENYIFKDLNLNIRLGEKVALVGDNGVGKSTLIKVIAGLFRDYEGDILIGGKSVKNVKTQKLFEIFSVVFQDVNLLAYTVEENITCKLGESKENEAKVWKCLEMAGMKRKIANAPKGLKQQIHKYIDEDGLEFSGGESQRIAIARAIYKDANIYILDEPTSSLDALAEKEIYETFGKITEDKTTIFISHRLASTKFCDRIILIGKNGLQEQGTHEELMLLRGKYYEMFSLQAKYYQEKNNEKNKNIC